MKTKIYQTIKGSIILFIKFQFSIKCNQAFKPLRISISNIYLNLSLIPNSLVTYIIPNIFVLSLIRLMILDIYIIKIFLYIIKSDSGLRIYH